MPPTPKSVSRSTSATGALIINLVPCPRFTDTVEAGRLQLSLRLGRNVSQAELLTNALNFIKGMTGDDLYERIYDAYDYTQTRKLGIRCTDEIQRLLSAITIHNYKTTKLHDGDIEWSERAISCAALFVFCNTLIIFSEKPLPVPYSVTSILQ